MKNIHVTIIVTIVLLISDNQSTTFYSNSGKKCNGVLNCIQQGIYKNVSNEPEQNFIEAGQLLHENLFFSRYQF